MVRRARRVATTIAAAGICLLVAPAAQARAPAPDFKEFFGCPEPPVVIDHCVVSSITGRVQLGRIELVLTAPMTQNGGVPPTFPAPFLFNAHGGMFSPRIAVRWAGRAQDSVDAGLTGVFAVLQLAGTPMSTLPFGNTLPMKVKLIHPRLGARCFIGSEAAPIRLDLTTGTTTPPPPNLPITGTVPGFGTDPQDPRISLVTGGVLVDNAFLAPVAKGCGPAGQAGALDAVVNRLAAFPAAGGTNTAVLDFSARLAAQSDVYPARS
jgi:hypothetical protein